MITTAEKITAIKEIAKLRAERAFVEAEIKHYTEILEKNVVLYQSEKNSTERQNMLEKLEELYFKSESITQELWEKGKILFK